MSAQGAAAASAATYTRACRGMRPGMGAFFVGRALFQGAVLGLAYSLGRASAGKDVDALAAAVAAKMPSMTVPSAAATVSSSATTSTPTE